MEGLWVWKWGINFNEGSMFSIYMPLGFAINLQGLWLYFVLMIPWLYHTKHWNRDPIAPDNIKKWRWGWKRVIQIVIRKKQ